MNIPSNARIYDLEQPRYFGAPVFPSHAPGFVYSLHRRHEQGVSEVRTSASGFVYMAEHSGTHIDALCHQAEEMRLYGGQEGNQQIQTPAGFTVLGGGTHPPLIARGGLLDVGHYRTVGRIETSSPVPPGRLEGTAPARGR